MSVSAKRQDQESSSRRTQAPHGARRPPEQPLQSTMAAAVAKVRNLRARGISVRTGSIEQRPQDIIVDMDSLRKYNGDKAVRQKEEKQAAELAARASSRYESEAEAPSIPRRVRHARAL